MVAFRNWVKKDEKEAFDHRYMKKSTAEDLISSIIPLKDLVKHWLKPFLLSTQDNPRSEVTADHIESIVDNNIF
jgi:hypothetical protein